MPTSRSVDLIGRAVREDAARGARLVGLGAYTSIVTGNATRLGPLPVPVTTGNAYTAASAVDGLLEMAIRRGVELATATCAVLGAAGSIGRAMTLLLAGEVGRLLLVGNPRTGSRKLAVLAELTGAAHTDAADAVSRADLVVAATSTPSAVIDPDWVKPNAIICDVAQPANVGPDLTRRRPDVTVFAGGLVDLPGGRPLGLSLGLPPGVSYACTAETMIIAGSPDTLDVSVGDQLSVAHLTALRAAGRRLGFRLHLPTKGRPLT
jgi:predicted amino acid dehydrogenase